MASNAFQCLIGDDEIRASLSRIRRALVDGGRFAFGSRHPQAKAWLDWNPGNAEDVVDHQGRKVRSWYEVESVHDDLVTFSGYVGDAHTTTTLRFIAPDRLNVLLSEAGFAVESQHGDFTGGELIAESPLVVTIARRR
jgi:hypothetical protein